MHVERGGGIDERTGMRMIAHIPLIHLGLGYGASGHVGDHALRTIEHVLPSALGDEHRSEPLVHHVHAAMRAFGLAILNVGSGLSARHEGEKKGKEKEE